ncbi:MerR family DNA-binding transcriptional regulator [Blastococcus sp. SYSU DS0510]
MPPWGRRRSQAHASASDIGDFSRMTYLSVKALRHYHETGLLQPAAVDPDTGTGTTARPRSARPK